MLKLPFKLPAAYVSVGGSTENVSNDVDTGGYDLTIGGHGFRLASDTNFPYQRATEPTTVHRYDSSVEPGEQTLSPLPWLKSQSSFHGGGGQINLEQGLTAFQYQQEQVEHIRFDASLGVDVWTPGQVRRLPDCHYYNLGFTPNHGTMVTATVSGIDYAIVGGVGGLTQIAWTSGPDSNPVVTNIDLSSAVYGGAANCNITSLATDGVSYFGLVQLTVAGSTPSVKSIIISGTIGVTTAPTPIYDIPSGTRTNLCTNPSFETSTTGWTPFGTTPPTLSTATAQKMTGLKSLQLVWNASATGNGAAFSVPTTAGQVYTVSLWMFTPPGGNGSGVLNVTNGGVSAGGNRGQTNQWVYVTQTWTATSTSSDVQIISDPLTNPTVGWPLYVDQVLIELSTSAGKYFDGSSATDTYSYAWTGTANASTSTATSAVTGSGVLGWSKARLIGALGPSVYELTTQVQAHSALPAARYTHPNSKATWTVVSESPNGVLVAAKVGNQATIQELALDTSGAVPTLAGGATVAVLPPGEIIYALDNYLASFLGIGTSYGLRIASFDTYTGKIKLGPATVTTTKPVYDLTGRDRFIFGGYSNQQQDGKTGLVRLDLSMVTDTAGRNAWAADLRPPTTAPTGLGDVLCVGLLPLSSRVIYVTAEGLHTEGNGPGADGAAWMRTSRIRYDTAELKLFKLGRVHGTLDVAEIQVTGIAPFVDDKNLGTFGFVTNGDPGEFRLPSGLNEWIQLEFALIGSACVLNSYQVKAYPAPKRQHVISFTVNCFLKETDRYGLEVTDPETPRQRLQNVVDLEALGDEVRLVEFTNQGAVAQLVLIDQLAFQSYSRPNIEDDMGGYITFKLRSTEG